MISIVEEKKYNMLGGKWQPCMALGPNGEGWEHTVRVCTQILESPGVREQQ
jgi:hypothetical protein